MTHVVCVGTGLMIGLLAGWRSGMWCGAEGYRQLMVEKLRDGSTADVLKTISTPLIGRKAR